MANTELKVAAFSVGCGRPVRVAAKGLRGQDLNTEAARRGFWLTNIGDDSMVSDYCQAIVPEWYRSNETRGSRGVRRSWRGICSLVRRKLRLRDYF